MIDEIEDESFTGGHSDGFERRCWRLHWRRPSQLRRQSMQCLLETASKRHSIEDGIVLLPREAGEST